VDISPARRDGADAYKGMVIPPFVPPVGEAHLLTAALRTRKPPPVLERIRGRRDEDAMFEFAGTLAR